MNGLDLKVFASRPRGAWMLFIVGLGIYGLLVLTEALGIGGGRPGAIPWSFWWLQILVFSGISLGAAERHQALSLPFSFALPGYRESLRCRSFARAVHWGLIVSLWVFSQAWLWRQLYSGLPSDVPKPSFIVGPSVLALSLGMAGGFFAGMAGCLLWINRTLVRFRQEGHMILIAGLGVAIVSIVWGDRPGYTYAIWSALILPSVLICRFFWLRLGKIERVKNGHRIIILYSIEKRKWFDLEMPTSTSVEKFFLCQMQRDGATGGRRFVWGWVYCILGPILSRWKWILMLSLAGVLALGYFYRMGVYTAFATLGGSMAGYYISFVRSSLLSPAGRRKRCWLAMVSVVVTTLLLGTASATAVVLSWLFAAIIPPIPLGTRSLQFTGFSMMSVLVACLPVLWFPLAVVFMRVILRSLHAGISILVLIVVSFVVMKVVPGPHPGPALVPILFACGWILLPLIAWIIYRRWDLDQ